MIYVTISEDSDDNSNVDNSLQIQIPCNDDDTLPLSTVRVYFPNVIGLKFRVGRDNRVLKLENDYFHPPKKGWGVDTIYYCVYRKAPTKRKAIDIENTKMPESKFSKIISDLDDEQLLNKIDNNDCLAKTILLTGELRDKLFNFLSVNSVCYRTFSNEIDILFDGSSFLKFILYDANEATGDQAGDMPKKLCHKNGSALITYEENSEKSQFTAKQIADKIKGVCPGCIFLVKMSNDLVSSPEVSLQRLPAMSEFMKIDLSDWTNVLEAFKKLIESSQYIALENWTSLKCFFETPRIFDPVRGKLRAYVQTLYTGASDPLILINQAKEDLKRYSQWHCVRLSSVPVVDILRCLLKSKQKSVLGHDFIDICVDEQLIIHQPMNDYPNRVPCFIIEFVEFENYQPIVFTTKVRYQGNEAQFLSEIPHVTDEEFGLDLESNDSGASENYEIERTLMYKLNLLGYPWRSRSSINSELLEKDTVDPLFQVPAAPAKENQNCTAGLSHADVGLDSTKDINKTSSIDSSQASDGTVSDDQNSNPSSSTDQSTPSVEKPVNVIDPTSIINCESKKNAKSKQRTKSNKTPQSGPRSKSDKTSSQSSQHSKSDMTSQSSQASKCGKKACQRAMVTTVKTKHGVTRVTGDRLVLDVIIYCSRIDLCRYLCAVFNLVHLDEILLNFENLKPENVSKSKVITFKTRDIAGILIKQWEEILECKEGCHRTLRMIQTRFSEYTNTGRHNIGVTCCEDVLTNVYANARTMIRLPGEYMSLHLYSIIVTLPEKYNFINAIAALTKILDLVFRCTASVIVPICFDGQYYKVPVSLISVIPFYILRSHCDSQFKENVGEFLVKTAKNLPPMK